MIPFLSFAIGLALIIGLALEVWGGRPWFKSKRKIEDSLNNMERQWSNDE
jgi:hypothetical protein